MASSAGEDGDAQSGAGTKQVVKWTERMEEAYEAALEQLGGLDAAKPKAVYELLQDEFPQLSVHNVKWHIQTHRKREEMRKHKPADYQGPTRWVGRLEEAYEAEVARQGGLHSARPKALLDALQPEFPELTLQIIKWHLQLQRRKDQQDKQRRAKVQARAQGRQQAAQQQLEQHGGAAGAAAMAVSLSCGSAGSPATYAHTGQLASSGAAGTAGPAPLTGGQMVHQASYQAAPSHLQPPFEAGHLPSPAGSSGGPSALHGSFQQQQQQQQQQYQQQQQQYQQQPHPQQYQQQQRPQLPYAAQQQAQQRSYATSQQHQQQEQQLEIAWDQQQQQQQQLPSGLHTLHQPQHTQQLMSAAMQQQATSQGHHLQPPQSFLQQPALSGAGQQRLAPEPPMLPLAPGAAPDGGASQLQQLRRQQLEQQRQLGLQHQMQQQQLLVQLLQYQHRSVPPPWLPFLVPAAQDALEQAAANKERCFQIVEALRQRVSELHQLLQILKNAGAVGMSQVGPGGSAVDLQQLLPLMEGLLPATVLHGILPGGSTYASRGGGRGWAAMAAAGGPSRMQLAPATRRQRTLASLAAAFPTVRDDAAAASWASGV